MSAARPRRPLLAVMLPTYNERENIADLVEAILALPFRKPTSMSSWPTTIRPTAPGRWAEERAAADPRVHALVRTKRRGRGAGGIDGFKAALALGPDYVVEMDADFSHAPKFIPDLLAAAGDYDLVLGSRFVPGGRDADRGTHRRLITLCVRTFIRRLISAPRPGRLVRDSACSAGRCSKPSTWTT